MDQRTPLSLIVRLALAWLIVAPLAYAQEPALTEALRSALKADKGWNQTDVAPGVTWKQQDFPSLFSAKQSLHILEIDQQKASLALEVLTEIPKPVSQIAQEKKALAAINGSYFDMKTMLSTTYITMHGALVSQPSIHEPRQRAALVIDTDGRADIIRRPEQGWKPNPDFPHLLASSPILVTHGKAWDHREHEYGEACHPRTAIGILPDHRILFLTVDGRAKHAVGMTYTELAHTMAALGCERAICLDGGGSTALWIKDQGLVNKPSNKSLVTRLPIERSVANAIVVLTR